MCTTAFHRVADEVEAAVDIPLVRLADVVAAACLAEGLDSVGLHRDAFAMAEPFFIDRLARAGSTVHVPAAPSTTTP